MIEKFGINETGLSNEEWLDVKIYTFRLVSK